MRTVRALLAEDEPLARESLREGLAAAGGIEVVGMAGDGREALALAERLEPDLVFLDVRLPELSGLEVARRLSGSAEIVFTTAYDRFALAAFELGALDYLLKPFGRDRLQAAVARARLRLEGRAEEPRPAERARLALDAPPVKWLFARAGDRIVPIPTSGIRRIQQSGDYAEVHCAEGQFLLHVTLGELLQKLDGRRFVQVHRSHVVSWDWVASLQRYDERRLVLTLRDGGTIVASRGASEALRRLAR